jgi:hypothetical protein
LLNKNIILFKFLILILENLKFDVSLSIFYRFRPKYWYLLIIFLTSLTKFSGFLRAFYIIFLITYFTYLVLDYDD